METEQTIEHYKEEIIPFIHRKSLLLSISFRAIDLDFDQFKMKVEPLENEEMKEPIITKCCDITIVIFNLYNFIGSKISN